MESLLEILALVAIATFPFASHVVHEVHKLAPLDASPSGFFGNSIATSASRVVIGAFLKDNTGSAYIFDARTGQQLFKLTASDPALHDVFGCSVGISDDTVIVGAHGKDGAGSNEGAAYIFDATTGKQLFKLTAADAAPEDRFGLGVAISGDIAIIGSHGDSDAGSSSGSAYLFDSKTGHQLLKLTASDAAPYDLFGISVAVSGKIAIIGASGDDVAGPWSGSAYLFDTATGKEIAKLTANDAEANDGFGLSVGISDDIAIVGAHRDSDAGKNSGSAYLFDTNTGKQLFKLTASDAAAYDRFGEKVRISGKYAIVGANQHGEAGEHAGSAYIFDTMTGQQLFKLIASDTAPRHNFGYSVDLFGTTAAVGACKTYDAGLNSGSAYIFNIPTQEPTP